MKLKQLEALLGADQVVAAAENHTYTLAGFPALPLAYVKNLAEMAEVIKLAATERWGLIPVGGGTKLSIGNQPTRADLYLSTQHLNAVVEHSAADLTATVEAGCSFAKFQQTIGGDGQFLPLDAPYGTKATLGGIVATASYGSLRYGYGMVRDWLVGLKVVTADGQITKAGGKVVKNVAGYDLMKLYTGSFGTLAIIGELNFKLRPLPTTDTTFIATFSSLQPLYQAVVALRGSQLLPAAVDLLSSQAATICFPDLTIVPSDLILAIRLMGSSTAVEYQCQQLSQLWQSLMKDLEKITTDSACVWERIVSFAHYYPHVLSLRISTLPAQIPNTIAWLQTELFKLNVKFELLAQMGNGILRLFIPQIAEEKLTQWRTIINILRTNTQVGSVVVEQSPLALQCDAWGEVGATTKLMQLIKKRLDPLGILNPGRFVMGI